MDFVSIKLNGYGCDLARGVVEKKEDYKKLKELNNNVWIEGLYKKVTDKTKLKEEIHNYGIINGDIIIEVNNIPIIDIPINFLETHCDVKDIVYTFKNNSNEVVVTTLQYYNMLSLDVGFVVNENFDINKLSVLRKKIFKSDKEVVRGLYSDIYYDNIKIPITYDTTDLRLSEMYFD